jgi:hypothetical protein
MIKPIISALMASIMLQAATYQVDEDSWNLLGVGTVEQAVDVSTLATYGDVIWVFSGANGQAIQVG